MIQLILDFYNFSVMRIKSIRQLKNLKGKKVFLRVDFNVPVKEGKVKDEFRIVAALPTIRYLLSRKARIILATHLGDPKLPFDRKYSTYPVAKRLEKLIGKKVHYVEDVCGVKAGHLASLLKDGEMMFLENLRYDKGEEKDDKDFAKNLAGMADIYVNNAFAVCHRKHASVHAIKKYLPSYAGLILEDEIVNLNKALKPKKPFVLVTGGAKISTKIRLINNLYRSAHKIIIGGALANNFLVAHGLEVGKSLVDDESIRIARKLDPDKILLPIDVVVRKGTDDKKAIVKNATEVKKDESILDIGPKTIELYASYIKKAQTIAWNGPMGMFESPNFRFGTLAIARVIAARSRGTAFGVVGGGETIEALNMTKMANHIDWVSTGGGAMLSYLGGEPMPGLKGIVS